MDFVACMCTRTCAHSTAFLLNWTEVRKWRLSLVEEGNRGKAWTPTQLSARVRKWCFSRFYSGILLHCFTIQGSSPHHPPWVTPSSFQFLSTEAEWAKIAVSGPRASQVLFLTWIRFTQSFFNSACFFSELWRIQSLSQVDIPVKVPAVRNGSVSISCQRFLNGSYIVYHLIWDDVHLLVGWIIMQGCSILPKVRESIPNC